MDCHILYLCTYSCMPQTLRALLKRDDIDVNAIDPHLNRAPIHSIVRRVRPDRLELLLALLNNSDVDVNLKTPDGNTPLHLAVEVGSQFRAIRIYSGTRYYVCL